MKRDDGNKYEEERQWLGDHTRDLRVKVTFKTTKRSRRIKTRHSEDKNVAQGRLDTLRLETWNVEPLLAVCQI